MVMQSNGQNIHHEIKGVSSRRERDSGSKDILPFQPVSHASHISPSIPLLHPVLPRDPLTRPPEPPWLIEEQPLPKRIIILYKPVLA
jgi:hypothetical protein